MESVWDKAVKAFAAFSGAVAGAFGGFDPVFRVLLACMVVDYISGVIVAVMGKSSKTASGGLDSKIGARGIAKKGLMLLVSRLGQFDKRHYIFTLHLISYKVQQTHRSNERWV